MAKRLFCFCVMICFLLISSFAYADQPERISFRGYEWGIHPEDFIGRMAEGGIEPIYEVEENRTAIWASSWGIYPSWKYSPVPVFSFKYRNNDKTPVCRVAGYNVRTVFAYFLTGISEDNKISYNIDDSVFVHGSYTISSKDQENPDSLADTKMEMINKLTSLYGEYAAQETDSTGGGSYCWIASDQSLVNMEISASAGGWFIHLRYDCNPEAYVKELEELAKQDALVNVGDVDGL